MAFSRSGMTFLDYPLKLNISQSVVQPGTCFMFGWVRASVGDSNANIALMRLVTIELCKNKPGIYTIKKKNIITCTNTSTSLYLQHWQQPLIMA